MKWTSFCFSVALAASGLLAAAPAINAQSGSMGAHSQQQQGTTPVGGGADLAQGITEPAFVALMRRNGEVEASLSKLATKNGSDAIKTLAKEIMSQSRKSQMMLASATASNPNLGSLPYEQVPDVTRQAQKQMKNSTGVEFDKLYISQISAYIQDDQATIAAANSSIKDSDLEMALPRMKDIADNQAKQIAQVAQSENIKIE